jgi:MFS family permease
MAAGCDKGGMLQMNRSHSANPFPIGLAGALAMASAMGFGRFIYTPILPGMIDGIPLTASDAGTIAAANFAGYLAGAILSAYGWAAGRERQVALAGLFATAALLAAMGLTTSVTLFAIIRFLAGLASALAMIFTSSVVLPHAAGRQSVNMLHFGGVGVGIALSSALVFIVDDIAGDAASGWRMNWLMAALFVFVVTLIVQRMLPRPISTGVRVSEPPLVWRLPLISATLSYGLFGFGYVITATFLVTIARQGNAGPIVEFLAWFVTGGVAAVSLVLWHPVGARFGIGKAYLAAVALLAIGVLVSVTLPSTEGALVGGALLGATFMVVTAFGLQIGRSLAPQSPRRVFAFMTASFGVGQIAGPLIAGWLAQKSGSFTAPTLAAAAVLAAAILIALPLAREGR